MSAAARPAKGGAFSVKVMLALVLVGLFSFSAFFTLQAYAPDLTSGNDGRAHALSHSAVGFAAAVALARATSGAEVAVSRAAITADHHTALYVLAPEDGVDEDTLSALSNERVLIILPKWQVFPSMKHRGWVVRDGVYRAEAVAQVAGGLGKNVKIAQARETTREPLSFVANSVLGRSDTLTPGPIEHLQTITGAGIEPVLTTADGRIVLGRLSDRATYVLADPDLLNTQGLAKLDTARAGMALLNALRDSNEPIVFDVTLNGFARERSLLRIALQPPFLAATLSLLAIAILLGWRSVTRSGPQAPPRRAIAMGKRALAENSAALIQLAHREHRLGKGYASLSRDAVVELLGLPRGENPETDATLDRIRAAQNVSSSYSELAKEAAAAQTPAQMLAAAQRLNVWKEEMLRATR